MKYVVMVFLALIAILSPDKLAHAQYVGVTLGWRYSSEDLEGPATSRPNAPLFNATTGNANLTWDSWAEELGAAGVDFVCPNLRGSYPHTEQSPVYIAPLITALQNRGLDKRIKLALFDDNAASWTWQWNEANGRYGNATLPFDISNSANWVYLWDYNYKIFYQTVPDANRFKINGRPVIIIWTGNTYFVGNMQGNVSRALRYIRQQCQSTFGFNPYIIVSSDFLQNDTTCNDPTVVDATESWFNPSASGNPNGAYTLDTFNNMKIGALCPGFQTPQTSSVWVDPNHGVTLDNALQSTRSAGALLTLIEGFTDWEEDAALFRVRNLAPNGSALGYAQTYYDYPNQRINLVRKNSNYPFPANLKQEAEGCDSFGGAVARTGYPNYYRNGNIWIEPTGDSGGGYNIGGTQAGEWLEWRDVPIQGSTQRLQLRVASPNVGSKIHFVIDGNVYPTITIPNTGGWQTYATVDDGHVYTFPKGSRHTVRIICETGGFNFNYWQARNDIPLGKQISLRSNANNKYVCADNAGAFPLIANRTSAGVWEKFTVVDASAQYGYGAVALLTTANNKYVTADTAGQQALIANRTSISSSEVFLWVDQGDGTVALRSLANSMTVCADNNGANPLINNRIDPGLWESFALTIY